MSFEKRPVVSDGVGAEAPRPVSGVPDGREVGRASADDPSVWRPVWGARVAGPGYPSGNVQASGPGSRVANPGESKWIAPMPTAADETGFAAGAAGRGGSRQIKAFQGKTGLGPPSPRLRRTRGRRLRGLRTMTAMDGERDGKIRVNPSKSDQIKVDQGGGVAALTVTAAGGCGISFINAGQRPALPGRSDRIAPNPSRSNPMRVAHGTRRRHGKRPGTGYEPRNTRKTRTGVGGGRLAGARCYGAGGGRSRAKQTKSSRWVAGGWWEGGYSRWGFGVSGVKPDLPRSG